MRTWILMCGGRKCPQNSKVGAESAPKMSKWGQKAPPQFGHDKIRMKVSIKVGAESAPQKVKSKFVCKFIFQLCGFTYATFIFKRFD